MLRHLLSIFDLSDREIWGLLSSARKLKSSKNKSYLSGKTLGLILEKPSTRTTVSFSVAMYQMGGFPLILDVKNLQRKRGESIHDTAKVLSGYLDGVMFRALKHSDVRDFVASSDIPVINGLTDKEHPCQILGDILTIIEKKRIKSLKELKKIKVAFVGDGNNVANSWIAAASILGFKFSLAGPKGYGPDKSILNAASKMAGKAGPRIEITNDASKAVKGADVIYTDVWTSMGEENERRKRLVVFKPYQVNNKLLNLANRNCLVMHCLPAVRGEEITADVIEGANSVVFHQAENRLHIQKAILLFLLK